MVWFILFIFGLAFGSFLNVVALRYDGEHFLLDTKLIGGRSHCVQCGRTLRWFELMPLVSFLIQGGRCRRCKARLSIQYPIVELLSGLIFVFVPLYIIGAGGGATPASIAVPLVIISILWIAVFEALLVMALIDIRLGIVPDEINIFLGALGIFLAIFSAGYFGAANDLFLGPYAAIFGWQGSVMLAKIIGAAVAGAFFALLIAVTRGKGMGMGDLKLAIPLGLIFGWPDIIFVLMFAFVIGAAAGLLAIARGRNTMKGTLPFGPFLALGAAAVFFWGAPIFGWYFSLLGIR
ncbi:MAG TPA: prepilin peptidase [Candidatus Paceibacterota bacterium]|nr:prepilin peptidase [Candidatus Paceibacterota bacterium]